MYDRYAALFALRNDGGDESVSAIIDSLGANSALLRHEVRGPTPVICLLVFCCRIFTVMGLALLKNPDCREFFRFFSKKKRKRKT